MSVPCFFIEPDPEHVADIYLRRYSDGSACSNGSYHNAKVHVGRVALVEKSKTDSFTFYGLPDGEKVEGWLDDERWPAVCECGYIFCEADTSQLHSEQVYVCTRSMPESAIAEGQETTLAGAPAGAMWYADWYDASPRGADDRTLCVRIPGGHNWLVDFRARNCGRPDDKIHKCWCRHGEPPEITVDKDCDTCAAGAGSIQIGDWHGFLRGGYLVT